MSSLSTRGRFGVHHAGPGVANGGASSLHSSLLYARASPGGVGAPAAALGAGSDQQQQSLLQHRGRGVPPPSGISWAPADALVDRSLTPSPVVPRGCKDFPANHDVAL